MQQKSPPPLNQRFIRAVLKKPLLTIFASLILIVTLGSGVGQIQMSSDFRYFFGKENPQRMAFEKMQNVYSKDDSVLIAITPTNKNVFTKQTLLAIKEMTKKAWELPYSTRVDSITNFQHTKAIEDDLIVTDMVKEDELLNSANLERIKQTVLEEPLLRGRLINQSADVTGINVTFNFPGKSPFEVPQMAKATRELRESIINKYPDLEIRLTGLAMMNNAFNEAGMSDMVTLTPIMYLAITIVMVVMLRSVSAVFSTLVLVFASILTGMGLAGKFGIPITPPSSIAPTVIATLAIADAVHIIKSILFYMSKGQSKSVAIVESMKSNILPVFLTSFTTAIGFLSLNFSDTPPFHDLGNITAMGVSAAFVYSVTLLPALIYLLPLKVKKQEISTSNWKENLADWLNKHSKMVLLSTVFITVLLGLQVPKIELNDQFVNYFDESVTFRTDTDYVTENLTGIYQVNYDFSVSESGGISSPKYLEEVEKFTSWLRANEYISHVSSISDTFKRLNKNMHADQQSFYSLPKNRELAAQYLLLYEMSLPYGLDLNNQINVDKSSTRVMATFKNVSTKLFLQENKKIEKWVDDNLSAQMKTTGASPAIMFSYISKRNVIAMAWGTLVAFSIITVTMIIALRSFKYGLISLLPNIIPTVLAFGLWSIFVGQAGFSIAIVCSVTLGIVVDDTVHFLTKYVRAKKELNMSAQEAVKYSLTNVGSALIVTSFVLVIGFLVLTFSPFRVNVVLGALSALTIIIALVVDFLFLPVLLKTLDSPKTEKHINKGNKMKIKNTAITSAVVLMAVGLGSNIKANPTTKGLEIAKKIQVADDGFINQTANVKMILKNKHGQQSTRTMKIKTLEVKNDGDKSLTIFKTPRDVKGTSFLSFSHSHKADDQWLFLPALKRVKRISSNNKSGPFMGSEFAYEDISSGEVDKYTYKYIKEDLIQGIKHHTIERYPVDKNSGYTRQILLTDALDWKIKKVQYFDRKNSLLKTLTYIGYKQYENGKWRPETMRMINHQSGKSTDLVWSDYKFNEEISSKDFNKNALKRMR